MTDAISIAGSGMNLHRKWLDAIADNIANANTVRGGDDLAFQERFIVAQEGEGITGVTADAALGDTEGQLVYEPTHPLANAQGYVRYPDIDLSEQMGQLIMAQRGYQANAAVVDRAKTAYEAALQIGRG
ncbi:flagellar basal-body rod protein FlgC [Cryobacterium frigoriphilum]|uniref:Flagellar basal-body rod protein FlgC n=1 Tax=Cryobacterium frigoriphilum TaxID=1259150 RepID=A0A4R8ZVK4_9MICO|nr:flagellar basal body rod C-terminal domain-containing protein [Cryobacterium frigoriphilum]TFD47267.1 flagellar basal-body rod protein FlgC [Cryobacterium frigoriphilum]